LFLVTTSPSSTNSAKPVCSTSQRQPHERQGSHDGFTRIFCGSVLQRIIWSKSPICVTFKFGLDIQVQKPPKFILTFLKTISTNLKTRSMILIWTMTIEFIFCIKEQFLLYLHISKSNKYKSFAELKESKVNPVVWENRIVEMIADLEAFVKKIKLTKNKVNI